jgi:hypothetical protein
MNEIARMEYRGLLSILYRIRNEDLSDCLFLNLDLKELRERAMEISGVGVGRRLPSKDNFANALRGEGVTYVGEQ